MQHHNRAAPLQADNELPLISQWSKTPCSFTGHLGSGGGGLFIMQRHNAIGLPLLPPLTVVFLPLFYYLRDFLSCFYLLHCLLFLSPYILLRYYCGCCYEILYGCFLVSVVAALLYVCHEFFLWDGMSFLHKPPWVAT